MSVSLPRPRDVIYLVRCALDHAVNAGNVRIEPTDLISALKQYSVYALNSLAVEGATVVPNLEAVLYEFAGCSEIVDSDDIARAVNKGHCMERSSVVATALVDLTFLGIEAQAGRFEFLFDDIEKPKFMAMARRLQDDRPEQRPRFRIGKPFHSFLEIVSAGPPTSDSGRARV